MNNVIVKFDGIALSETWIIPEHHDLTQLNYEGCSITTKSINGKYGGGVPLYVNENLECDEIWDISKVIENSMESIFVKKNAKQKEIESWMYI